jgi:hypothetical protein
VSKTMVKLEGDIYLGEGRLSVSSNFFSQNNTMALDLLSDWISDLKKIRCLVHQAEYGDGGPQEISKDMFEDDPIAYMEAKLRYDKNKEAEESDGI